MAANSLQELYVEQLQDLCNAEQQSIKTLPKMIEAAQSEELRGALSEHLEVTKAQATRIEKICQELGEDPENEKCKGMEGVLKEGSDLVKEVGDEVRDAAIIASTQRVEHYEMVGYGTARTFATLLGFEEAASLLEQTAGRGKGSRRNALTSGRRVECRSPRRQQKGNKPQGKGKGTAGEGNRS